MCQGQITEAPETSNITILYQLPVSDSNETKVPNLVANNYFN